MADVLTLTVSPTLDISSQVDHVVPERKLRCSRPTTEPGGGGVNVARVLTRFGVDTLALITAGGRSGQTLIELLEAEGIALQAIPITDATRENVTILEESTMLQYRFCMPGPRLQPDELQAVVRAVEHYEPRPEYLVISGSQPPELPDDAITDVIEVARERGIRVVVDTSGPALRAAIDAGVFLVKPNLAELASLEGETWIESDEQLHASAQRLVSEGNVEAAVVSLGAAGALAVSSEGMVRIPAPPVRPVSKVGAGDSMVGGIIWGLMRGMSVLEAAVLGVAAGSAAVMSPGTELCKREDVERIYAASRERGQLAVA
ncbi:MAG TPA: 1-phosphofructokinase family hexose kinase [Thermomicrobiales bacterium]|nr:1-phosphofructokinase family hexose kinase [Thermomicrobiales bacterium]